MPIFVTKSILPDRIDFDDYVDCIFESGWLTNHGKLVQKLERELEAYLGVRNVVLVSNGTLALQVAYKLLYLKGEVITSPFTFIATASSMVWDGLDVQFSDIDPNSFNLDASKIEENIDNKTCAIVPVHVFGNPCDAQAIQKIADSYNLKVIYDASHAFGVKFEGESILNQGNISTLSFHATKLFHTIEGGALIINDDKLCEKARKMINFGITGPETIECLGINAKMNEFQAAMGLSLLGKMDAVIRARKALVECYNGALSEHISNQVIPVRTERNYSYYPILLSSESLVLKVQEVLNDRKIFPRRYFYPSLNTLDLFSKRSMCPVSEDISKRILCLPLFPELSMEDCSLIGELVLSVLDNRS